MNEVGRERIYLDSAATTALDERVLAAMLPYLTTEHGNPSSQHAAGRAARKAVEEARERIAAIAGGAGGAVRARQVVFTSGATEAANLALLGTMAKRSGGLITSLAEHSCVLASARELGRRGRRVAYLRPDRRGELDLEALRAALAEQAGQGGTALVALMLVNNETGVVTDTAAFAELAHEHGALFFCDAVQGLGLEPVSLAATGADLLALSAHKVYGPKGVGALVMARGAEPAPISFGGAQEAGLRPGTQPVFSIVGFAHAAAVAEAARPAERARLAALQAAFEGAALALPGVSLNGASARRGVKQSNLQFAGVDGETLLMALDTVGVCASAGSACTAGSLEASHVLTAMGLSEAEAKASVRFSFGRSTSEAELEEALARLAAVLERCRAVASS